MPQMGLLRVLLTSSLCSVLTASGLPAEEHAVNNIPEAVVAAIESRLRSEEEVVVVDTLRGASGHPQETPQLEVLSDFIASVEQSIAIVG